jgi:hypothetical protein
MNMVVKAMKTTCLAAGFLVSLLILVLILGPFLMLSANSFMLGWNTVQHPQSGYEHVR